jgi:hypothetical protein
MFAPGDIFLTKGNSFVSRAIRFFSRTGGESRTQANHTGLVVGVGDHVKAPIVEALTTVKRRMMYSYSSSKNTQVAVFRPLNVSEEDMAAIVARANGYVGRKYGYLKLVTHLMDYFLGGRYVFRRLTNSDRYPICSWVVACAYSDGGLTFGVEPGAASPDDIWDFCVSHPDKYQMIKSLEDEWDG